MFVITLLITFLGNQRNLFILGYPLYVLIVFLIAVEDSWRECLDEIIKGCFLFLLVEEIKQTRLDLCPMGK